MRVKWVRIYSMKRLQLYIISTFKEQKSSLLYGLREQSSGKVNQHYRIPTDQPRCIKIESQLVLSPIWRNTRFVILLTWDRRNNCLKLYTMRGELSNEGKLKETSRASGKSVCFIIWWNGYCSSWTFFQRKWSKPRRIECGKNKPKSRWTSSHET